jgi:hypothetical protein
MAEEPVLILQLQIRKAEGTGAAVLSIIGLCV